MLDPSAFYGLAGVPLVVALVQLVKGTWPTVPDHYWPAVTLAVAIAFDELLAIFLLHTDPALAALVGVVTGLSASGLYSWATKAVAT